MIRIVVNLFRRWFAEKQRHPIGAGVGQFVYGLPFLPGRRFGVIQGYGGTYSHTGENHFSIDFGMPEGTPVCAARAGVVYQVTDHFSEGGTHASFKPKANAVYVLHGDDTAAAYVHLAHGGARVRAGDFVTAGEVIGLAGSTGWSGCPHLHFHVADAITRRRVPTWFDTVEWGVTIVEAGGAYTRSVACRPGKAQTRRPGAAGPHEDHGRERDPTAYRPELLELGRDVVSELSAAGYEALSDYSSVEPLHDVHGLEVCGVRNTEATLDIVRLLLRLFPGWNAQWFGPPDGWRAEEWVARVQRDRDPVPESWDHE